MFSIIKLKQKKTKTNHSKALCVVIQKKIKCTRKFSLKYYAAREIENHEHAKNA